MQLDAAQILRQTIASTKFDASATGVSKPDSAVESGMAMGYGVDMEDDPLADLMDSMEELSLEFEEVEEKENSFSVVYEANGRCEPFVVRVFKDGMEDRDALTVNINRFGRPVTEAFIVAASGPNICRSIENGCTKKEKVQDARPHAQGPGQG